MRFKEIIAETTSAGAVATVPMPLGATQTRGGGMLTGKYTTDPTPNTPKEYKRNKVNARGRFKNSPSN
jgi:hypothetical protein